MDPNAEATDAEPAPYTETLLPHVTVWPAAVAGGVAPFLGGLAARHGRSGLPGLRRQLRPPRLPGALARAGAALPLPLPWRRLLRQRRARRRPAAARPLPL